MSFCSLKLSNNLLSNNIIFELFFFFVLHALRVSGFLFTVSLRSASQESHSGNGLIIISGFLITQTHVTMTIRAQHDSDHSGFIIKGQISCLGSTARSTRTLWSEHLGRVYFCTASICGAPTLCAWSHSWSVKLELFFSTLWQTLLLNKFSLTHTIAYFINAELSSLIGQKVVIHSVLFLLTTNRDCVVCYHDDVLFKTKRQKQGCLQMLCFNSLL